MRPGLWMAARLDVKYDILVTELWNSACLSFTQTETQNEVLSWCTGSQGNNQDSLASCRVLLGPLYRLLLIVNRYMHGDRTQNDSAYLQRWVDVVLFFLRTICKTSLLLSIRSASFSCKLGCNATMTNKKPLKLQEGCYTQATLREVEGRSTFLATRNATIAFANGVLHVNFFLATCNATFLIYCPL